MVSAAATADWFDEERRKQNMAIAAILLACLLVAFFPRNERRLFDFPGEAAAIATIGAPVQTRLRSPISGSGPSRHRPADENIVPLLPLPEIDIDLFGDLQPPEWSIIDQPLRFEQPEMPGLADLTQRDWMADKPAGNFLGGGIPIYTGAVPEPASWALMILGVSLIARSLRAERLSRRRRRGIARWRRNLVPRRVAARSSV